MKKTRFLILCGLLLFVMAGVAGLYVQAHRRHVVDHCRAGNLTILCLGDSITSKGYPEVLQRILTEKGFENLCVRNLGRRGDTSGEYLAYLKVHPNILNGRTDIVLVQLGTNDVRIDHDHTDTQTFAKNMEKIVGLIRKIHPKAQIFIATIPPVLKDVPGYFDWTSRRRVSTEINPFITRLARQLVCTRVDVYQAFKGHPEWYEGDGIHPNETGTRKLAEVYVQAVLPTLSKMLGVIRYTLPPDFHESVAFQSNADGDTDIYLLTPDGLKKLTNNTYPDEYPVFSPDGTQILYMTKPEKTWKLALLTPATGTTRVVVDLKDKNTYCPAWCPDEKRIVFATDMWGKSELALYDLKTKKLTRLTDTVGINTLPDCSPDGKTIVFTGNRGLGWRIYLLNLKTRQITKLMHKRGNCRPHFAPDAKWIAFVSEADGKSDIFLMHPDGKAMHSLTKDPKHWEYYPAWSRDGKRMYFSKSSRHWGAPWHLWVIHADGSHAFQITNGFSQDRFASVY